MMRQKKKAATILDVAREAGVSASTVSRLLTGNAGVTQDKQAAIMAAIEALGYRPNTVARGLVNGSSSVIGVLSQHVASPFYGEILTGIEYGMRDTPYSPMIIPVNEQVKVQTHALDVFLDRRVDGIIFLGGTLPDERFRQLADEIPFIVVLRTISGIEKHCIYLDNFQGAYDATRHLIDLGHSQIAHVSGLPMYQDSLERQKGYERALIDAGLQVDPRLIVQGDYREQSGILALEMLLTRGVAFSAIFVANDQMAQGVQLALYRRRIRVPEEVSIVGFDDQPSSAFSRPPLTTVRQPAFDIGLAASQGVFAMLNGEEPNFPPLTTELIVRESTINLHPQRSRTMMNSQVGRTPIR
jgi:LacI family transcriptional regulator